MIQPATIPSVVAGGAQLQALDMSELMQQTGLLGELVQLTKDGKLGQKTTTRLARHSRYKA